MKSSVNAMSLEMCSCPCSAAVLAVQLFQGSTWHGSASHAQQFHILRYYVVMELNSDLPSSSQHARITHPARTSP